MAEPTEQAGPAGSSTAPEEHLVYQPLSLLAMAGLGIAVLYAAIVLIGFLAALLSSSPWLMPTWSLIFPIAAIALSLVARSRIQRSEGTLAGRKLTTWGIGLGVLFGLIYLAHSAAVYLVLRQQADAFVQEWLDELKSGRVENAFRLSLPPANRPAKGATLRGDLELRFNASPEPGRKGMLSEFEQSEIVRFLVRAGEQVEAKLLSVSDWDYLQGGYQVRLNYRISTPESSFDLVVPAHGAKSASQAVQGRQWQIVLREVGLRSLKPTAQGSTLLALQGQAQAVFDAWLTSLRTGQLDHAYLSTLEPARRKQAWDIYQTRTQVVPTALLGSLSGGLVGSMSVLGEMHAWRELALPGFGELSKGELVRLNPDRFWPTDRKRQEEVLVEVRKLLEQPAEGLGRSLERERVGLLEWSNVNGQLIGRLDVRLRLGGDLQVDGFVLLECDAEAAAKGPPVEWRVAGLELVRATVAHPGGPPRGPPRPGH